MASRGGVYIPPHRLRALQASQTDHQSPEYQRNAWEALRKSLNGVVNKVNAANMPHVLPELFHENLVRGRGLFVRSLMRAQMASPIYTPVYSALISVVNTKLPEIGELLVRRVVIQFRKAYKRNQKVVAVALSKFIAHLVNQGVAHEILALQVLTLLLEAPTDDSVEVGVAFTKEAGAALGILAPAGLHAVFERFRTVLQEGSLDRRVQYTIEGLFAVRKTKFTEFPSIPPELDLVEEEDRVTHEIGLDDEGLDAEELLDVFKLDPEWESGESAWAAIRREILGDPVEDGVDPAYPGGGGDGGEDHDEHQGAVFEEGIVISGGGGVSGVGPLPGTTFVAHFPPGGGGETGSGILDMSETDLVNLRRTIYLTIMSSANFEECVHKLLKMALPRCVHVASFSSFFGLPTLRLSQSSLPLPPYFCTPPNTPHPPFFAEAPSVSLFIWLWNAAAKKRLSSSITGCSVPDFVS